MVGAKTGFTLVELVIVMVILILLSAIFLTNLSRFSRARSIEDDCKKIHAFAQRLRMDAFTKKESFTIGLSSNGTKVCDGGTPERCIDLENRFAASGNITVTDRGTYSTGNIHVTNISGNPSFSCVVFSSTRSRLGEWNETTSTCEAK